MSDEFELSRRKVLAGMGVVGGASAGAGLGATALLGDEEAFSNDRLVAGSLDLRAAWQAHYADGRGAETTYARRPASGEQPAFRLPAPDGGADGRDIERVFEDPTGDDGGSDSRPGEADGGRQFLRNTREGRANGGLYAGPDDLCLAAADVPDDAVVDLTDVKPGDFGFVLFRLRLCDNPGFLWLTGGLERAGENGVTEPEGDSPREDGDPGSTDPADVELLDAVRVAYGVGTTDDLSAADPEANLLPDPDPDSAVPQPATQASLREFLARIEGGGIPLAGDVPASAGGGTSRSCFSADTSHYVSLVWWVPPDRGNEIQSDEVSFDLGFYAEQCRNNDGIRAGIPTREARLLATDPAAGAYFGADVALDGDRIAVSADGRDLNGADSGAVYTFDRGGDAWRGTGPIAPSDGASGDLFGESVALDGDTLVVGATGDAGNGTDAGAAYVFDHDGSGWSRAAKLTPDDAAAGDSFGQDVAVSGDRVLVGADGDSSNGTESGAAYVFERTGGWSQATKLSASDGDEQDYFGSRVALDDRAGTAVVGAYGDEENGPNAGAAYVFDRASGGWSRAAKLTPADGSDGDFFGSSVATDGRTVLVGAFGVDDGGEFAGAAYTFARGNGTWPERDRLDPPTPAAGGFFGWDVALDGDTALVGAYGESGPGEKAGAAHVFTRRNEDWIRRTRLSPAGTEGDDRFGVALDAGGGAAVVAADGDREIGPDTGAAYVFRGGDRDD